MRRLIGVLSTLPFASMTEVVEPPAGICAGIVAGSCKCRGVLVSFTLRLLGRPSPRAGIGVSPSAPVPATSTRCGDPPVVYEAPLRSVYLLVYPSGVCRHWMGSAPASAGAGLRAPGTIERP